VKVSSCCRIVICRSTLGIFFRGRKEVAIPGVIVIFIQSPVQKDLEVLIIGQGLVVL
jgi:hypothetical protein